MPFLVGCAAKARANVAREQQSAKTWKGHVDSGYYLAMAQNMYRGRGVIDVPEEVAPKPSRGKGVPGSLSRILRRWDPMTNTPPSPYRQRMNDAQEAFIRRG